MRSHLMRWVAAFLLLVPFLLAGQTNPAEATAPASSQAITPQIKSVPAPHSDPTSGKAMYEAYCASCHGIDGRGDGPAAGAMKTQPTNLTKLAASNGGSYPEAHVAGVIKGEALTPSHGAKDMPVWGPVFLALGQHQSSEVQLRIRNLVKYLGLIQQR